MPPVVGTSGDDVLQGTDCDDHISGGAGNDILTGGAGDDSLYGGTGNDILIGGTGNDYLDGGTGDDILNGGEGSDTYIWGIGGGHDIIFDYDSNPSAGDSDTLIFDSTLKYIDVCFDRCNDDLTISVGQNETNPKDTITIADWFKGKEYQIEELIFEGDSSVTWTNDQINAAANEYGNEFCGVKLNCYLENNPIV